MTVGRSIDIFLGLRYVLLVLTAKQALDYWQDQKLLTKKKADELRQSLPDSGRMQAISIFTALGAVLIGLGVILFVGSHWNEIADWARVLLLISVMLITGIAGYVMSFERHTYQKTGIALLFVNILVYGATIFLIAQIYHMPLEYWWGALLWFLGTAYFAYALRSRLHLWLAVPLLLLFLGWLRSAGTGSEVDFLFNDTHSLFPLFPAIGLGLMALSVIQEKWQATRFGTQTLLNWGMFLLLFFLTISTIDKELFFGMLRLPLDAGALTIVGIAAALTVIACVAGAFNVKEGRAGLIALSCYLCFIGAIAFVPQWMGMGDTIGTYGIYNAFDAHPAFIGLFIVHILLVIAAIMTVLWYGTLLHRPALINMGILAIAIVIFIQYFSWAFDLLPRSLAFIVGGALILFLGGALERQRRSMLRSAHISL